MKLKSVYFTEKTTKAGIKPFKLERLDDIVCLVGKNGSGKSRALKLISSFLDSLSFEEILTGSYFSVFPTKLNALLKENLYEPALLYARMLDMNAVSNNPSSAPYMKLSQAYSHRLQSLKVKDPQVKAKIESVFKELRKELQFYIKIVKHSDLRVLNEAMDNSFETAMENLEEESLQDEFALINKNALRYLKNLPSQLIYDDYETKGDQKKFRARKSFKRFSSLKSYITAFLDKDLTWEGTPQNKTVREDGTFNVDFKGTFKLENRDLNFNELSDGEKVLFSYCLLFFLIDQNPRVGLKKSIVVIDEPELNLHPKAQINLLKILCDVLKEEGQLWIATHSLNLLAELQVENLILVKDGELFHPSSSTPLKSIEQLMGLEEHYYKFSNLLTSVANWSYVNFTAQCISNPEIIESATSNDPQVKILKKYLMAKSDLRLLDFGAGKGRLFKELGSFLAKNEQGLAISRYDTFEVNESCISELKKMPGVQNVYTDLDEIPTMTYDLVILCGVLHEIPVVHWIESLNKIISALSYQGYLMIIEDQLLPKGELPNQHGYLILKSQHLKTLFSLKSLPISIEPENDAYKNRITCSVIKQDQFSAVSKETVINTLKDLKDETKGYLKEIKKNSFGNDLKDGRLLAFHSQHYINIELALDILKQKR